MKEKIKIYNYLDRKTNTYRKLKKEKKRIKKEIQDTKINNIELNNIRKILKIFGCYDYDYEYHFDKSLEDKEDISKYLEEKKIHETSMDFILDSFENFLTLKNLIYNENKKKDNLSNHEQNILKIFKKFNISISPIIVDNKLEGDENSVIKYSTSKLHDNKWCFTSCYCKKNKEIKFNCITEDINRNIFEISNLKNLLMDDKNNFHNEFYGGICEKKNTFFYNYVSFMKKNIKSYDIDIHSSLKGYYVDGNAVLFIRNQKIKDDFINNLTL